MIIRLKIFLSVFLNWNFFFKKNYFVPSILSYGDVFNQLRFIFIKNIHFKKTIYILSVKNEFVDSWSKVFGFKVVNLVEKFYFKDEINALNYKAALQNAAVKYFSCISFFKNNDSNLYINKYNSLSECFKKKKTFVNFFKKRIETFSKEKKLIKSHFNLKNRYVCLHIRTKGKQIQDSNPADYIDIIKFLIRKNFKVILMGDKFSNYKVLEKKFRKFDSVIFYYNSNFQNRLNDIILLNDSTFYIGNTGGLTAIALSLLKKTLVLDALLTPYMYFYKNFRYVPKIYLIKKKKIIEKNFFNILQDNIFFNFRSSKYTVRCSSKAEKLLELDNFYKEHIKLKKYNVLIKSKKIINNKEFLFFKEGYKCLSVNYMKKYYKNFFTL